MFEGLRRKKQEEEMEKPQQQYQEPIPEYSPEELAYFQQLQNIPGYGQPGQMFAGQSNPTLSQEYLLFVDGCEDVPKELIDKLWGAFTRHAGITQIPSEYEFSKLQASIRRILRPFMWSEEITLDQFTQVQHYCQLTLMKSLRGVERRLISPGIMESIRTETVSQNTTPEHKGIIGSIFGR